MGAGETSVRCMLRISLARPNFHSVSESCCKRRKDKYINMCINYRFAVLQYTNALPTCIL